MEELALGFREVVCPQDRHKPPFAFGTSIYHADLKAFFQFAPSSAIAYSGPTPEQQYQVSSLPKYSVCIPTRERHGTLHDSIASVLNQTFDDFELIVQDNMSSPETRAVVESFDDPRLRYARSEARLPMHVNWECALDQVRGDYVIFIGDDDALMPDCLERVDPIVRHDKPEVLAWTAHLYYWPDALDERRQNHLCLDVRSGSMWTDGFANDADEIVTSHKFPDRSAGTMYLDSKKLLKNWMAFSGPRLYVPTYHNLISKNLIERSRKATNGTYFFIPAPDFASLILNLYFTDDVLLYPRALSVGGHSGKSNGGTHGQERAFEEAARRFFKEADLKFEDFTPTPFEPILWNAVILGKCFELVKEAVFPDDHALEVDWQKFLMDAATQVSLLPEEKQQICRNWVIRSAERIGMDPQKIHFTEPPEWERTRGMMNDGLGRVAYINVDGNELDLNSMSDAISVARMVAPRADFPIEMAGHTKKVDDLRARLVSQKETMSAKIEQISLLNASQKDTIKSKNQKISELKERLENQKQDLKKKKEEIRVLAKRQQKEQKGTRERKKEATESLFRKAARRLS